MSDRDEVWHQVGTQVPLFTHEHDIGNNHEAVREIVLGGSPAWARTHARFMPSPGKRVMDVGANLGVYSAFCAIHGAEVSAYEANVDAFAKLCEMIRQTGLIQITPIPTAVWMFTGWVPFVEHKTEYRDIDMICFNGGVKSDGVNWAQNDQDRAQKVPCVSFDDAIGRDKWDMVKMDIEGAEFEVLRYASVDALRRIKFMFVEFHPWASQEMYDATIQRLHDVFIFTGNDPDTKNNDRWQSAHLLNPNWALM